MFTISVETSFNASHQLTLPDGSKEQKHCHNWIVIAEVSRAELDSTGLVMDFNKLKKEYNRFIREFNDFLFDLGYRPKRPAMAEDVCRRILSLKHGLGLTWAECIGDGDWETRAVSARVWLRRFQLWRKGR